MRDDVQNQFLKSKYEIMNEKTGIAANEVREEVMHVGLDRRNTHEDGPSLTMLIKPQVFGLASRFGQVFQPKMFSSLAGSNCIRGFSWSFPRRLKHVEYAPARRQVLTI